MKWLLEETVLAIHKRQIAEHGGDDGIRDAGLLSSAMARPRNQSEYDEDADIPSLAAAYAFGLTKNHAFIDGNKRTGLVAARTFLLLNGFDIEASQEEKYLVFMKLAASQISEADLSEWFRENCRSVNSK